MLRSDYENLVRICGFCEEVGETLKRYGADFEIYKSDLDYQKSIAFSVLQISALSGKLSENFRKDIFDSIRWLPAESVWSAVSADGIDHEVIWQAATKKIPELHRFCNRRILSARLWEAPDIQD